MIAFISAIGRWLREFLVDLGFAVRTLLDVLRQSPAWLFLSVLDKH